MGNRGYIPLKPKCSEIRLCGYTTKSPTTMLSLLHISCKAIKSRMIAFNTFVSLVLDIYTMPSMIDYIKSSIKSIRRYSIRNKFEVLLMCPTVHMSIVWKERFQYFKKESLFAIRVIVCFIELIESGILQLKNPVSQANK